ncbi:M48 family metallopeptidase [Sporomusa sphaeroides]|uniref:M48 family metallopeptidase n=1 Tax=Sporomusa sphaeroides TaxID=47679 RepID=UPI003DA0B9FD
MHRQSFLIKCKTILLVVLFTATTLLSAPATAHASIASILLGGVVQYTYLKKTLTNMHYNENDKILDNFKKEYGVNHDETANRQLDSVMTRLLASIDPQGKIKPPFSWFVNNQTSFNAFCGLGNTVSVNIGLFQELNYNEDELAFVLAHELTHGLQQHSLKSLPKVVSLSVAQALYQEKNPNVASAITTTIISRQLIATHTTMPQEREADANSFTYAVNAGYNPGAGAAIWARISAKNGGKTRSTFENIINPNDHPTNQERVNSFSERLTEYSHNKVRVKQNTVFVNDKPWVTPLAANGLLAEERAYFIAGSLATVFHEIPAGKPCIVKNGSLTMNGEAIMDPIHTEKSPAELAEQLNRILGF